MKSRKEFAIVKEILKIVRGKLDRKAREKRTGPEHFFMPFPAEG